VICPTGNFSKLLSSPFVKNKSLRYRVEAALVIPAVPHPHEGRFAIVTNVGRGMRWTLGDVDDVTKVDGEVVWS
jgi:hypothetical protein